MAYGIHRAEKCKGGTINGIQCENNRTAKDKGRFQNSDIDWERTEQNVHLIKSQRWHERIKEELANHGIQKARKDSVLLIDSVYTASPEFFQDKSKEEIVKYFKECLEFHERHYGVTINAVIHFDETTPHLHCASVPILEKENGEYTLSAKRIMGNRKDYSDRQTAFHVEVTERWGLERGVLREDNNLREHTTKQEHKAKQANLRLSELEHEISENMELERKTAEETKFILQQKIEAAEIKIPFFKGKSETTTYHKDSLVKAIDIANSIEQHMKDNQFSYIQASEERKGLSARKEELERMASEIEPLHQDAIQERDKWRDANEHLKDIIEEYSEQKAVQMFEERTKGYDLDKISFMEDFMKQYKVDGVSLRDLCIKAWEEFLEKIDFHHGLRL